MRHCVSFFWATALDAFYLLLIILLFALTGSLIPIFAGLMGRK